jgi:CheY-like chemotaxis protein
MDMVMPGMGGVAAAGVILDRRPPPVVVLISVDDPSLDPRALALGDRVACVRKQDLLPARLTELWETRQPELAGASVGGLGRVGGRCSGWGLGT